MSKLWVLFGSCGFLEIEEATAEQEGDAEGLLE